MKIISISGLDGSGKSTQIQLLKEHFENKGKKVFYFHAVQFSIANILNKKNRHCEECSDNEMTWQSQKDVNNPTEIATPACPVGRSLNAPRNDMKNITKASWSAIFLRKVALFIDVHRFKILLKKLVKEDYNYILTDRYFYDMIVNIAYLSKKFYIPFFFTKINTPNYKFFLEINPETIMTREDTPSQGLEYLKNKNQLFKDYKEIFHLIEINGNKEKQEIFDEIKNYTI